jgi:hypothetical protein
VVTTPFGWGHNLMVHHWSPDGTKVAYGFRDPLQTSVADDMWVADVSQGPVDALQGLKLYDANIDGQYLESVSWSTHAAADQRIAFGYGTIRTVRPDGTDMLAVASGNNVCWSPDNKFLAFNFVQQKAFKWTYHVGRVPAGGGTLVVLTSDLDSTRPKPVHGWCLNADFFDLFP